MTNLKHHYKEREPQETIQIISTFFNNRNIIIKRLEIFHSEIDTFSCSYGLFWHNKQILRANGKGESPIYAKASCFAELYERFCLWSIQCCNNKFIIKDKKNNKQYLSKEEILQDTYCSHLFSNLLPNLNDNDFDEFLEIFYDNKLLKNEYQSLYDKNDIINKSSRIISLYCGTTGFAAGNTIEEALVQGLSELFERYALQCFYKNLADIEYYYINNEKLNLKFQKYISSLQQLYNIEVRIYDLSYNYNIPVCLLLLINKDKHLFYMNYGAAPVFDIAVERCFTEIYQGCNIFPDLLKIYTRPVEIDYNEACKDAFKSALIHKNIIIPEQLILHSKQINEFNSKIFLPVKNYTNNELLNHLIIISLKNNFNLYWTDISLMESIKAIHIIFKDHTLGGYANFDWIQHLSLSQRKLVLDTTKYVYTSFEKVITQKVNDNEIEQFCNNIFKFFNDLQAESYDEASDILMYFIDFDIFDLFTCNRNTTMDNYKLFYYILINDFNNDHLTLETTLKEKYQAYLLYFKYLQDNYNKQNINKILNDTLNFNIDMNIELQEITPLYLIKKIFINELYDLYNSQEYQDFLNLMNKDECL